MLNFKRQLFGLFMALLLVLSFVSGRAYGWYEADRFMEDVAKSLGVVVERMKK
jgi:hypothetical protein